MKPNNTDKVSNSTMDALYNRASYVIELARETAYRQVNEALVKRGILENSSLKRNSTDRIELLMEHRL